jgi:hypothetical protein
MGASASRGRQGGAFLGAVAHVPTIPVLVADIDWPQHAVTMRVLDLEGHEVHSAVKGDDKN